MPIGLNAFTDHTKKRKISTTILVSSPELPTPANIMADFQKYVKNWVVNSYLTKGDYGCSFRDCEIQARIPGTIPTWLKRKGNKVTINLTAEASGYLPFSINYFAGIVSSFVVDSSNNIKMTIKGNEELNYFRNAMSTGMITNSSFINMFYNFIFFAGVSGLDEVVQFSSGSGLDATRTYYISREMNFQENLENALVGRLGVCYLDNSTSTTYNLTSFSEIKVKELAAGFGDSDRVIDIPKQVIKYNSTYTQSSEANPYYFNSAEIKYTNYLGQGTSLAGSITGKKIPAISSLEFFLVDPSEYDLIVPNLASTSIVVRSTDDGLNTPDAAIPGGSYPNTIKTVQKDGKTALKILITNSNAFDIFVTYLNTNITGVKLKEGLVYTSTDTAQIAKDQQEIKRSFETMVLNNEYQCDQFRKDIIDVQGDYVTLTTRAIPWIRAGTTIRIQRIDDTWDSVMVIEVDTVYDPEDNDHIFHQKIVGKKLLTPDAAGQDLLFRFDVEDRGLDVGILI